jgi:hypothetical protein
MIPVQKSRIRTHFDPESSYIDANVRKQKNKLISTLTDYITKSKPKGEILNDLADIEQVISEECCVKGKSC